jgi:hypothetical protein
METCPDDRSGIEIGKAIIFYHKSRVKSWIVSGYGIERNNAVIEKALPREQEGLC